ncbi:MAG: ATPase [Candidatus Egerieousia sp.]|nr:ATPase [Bacteroidales bacterium]MCI6917477.1 ATPase [bacterium]MDD5962658.1 ATPase [bacterium]MDD7072304.1 ATPase [bacterium]MDY5255609.1 ATPase [Candidatus Egerieousia sp.]
MQLIADSGSTKVDWRAIKDDGSIVEISTEGINPVFITPEEIVKILSQKLLPVIGPGVKNVYFYGAGVVSPQLIATLSESFKKVFPESETFAASDVLAAARALCGHNPGIACIMGTGSNSCFYDGENIAKNVRAGGFILGDEASGGVLGKKLISDFIKGLLPAHIQAEFDKRYDLDYMKVVEKVYKQPMPSRFLASFAPFINEFIADPYMENLVNTSFDEFFKRNISQYDYKNHTVNFVGSIAFYFKDKLVAAAERNGMKVGRVLKTPIEGLVEYHKGII